MTAPLAPAMIDERYEIYRVATDYEGICDVFRDRVEDIEATRLGVDAAGGFALGHASTLLCRPQIKGYGPDSLTHMLKACGMALVFVIDDERFAKVRAKLGKRERPLRQQANASSARPVWLFKRKKAREYGKNRWSTLSEPQRKKLARKMGKASGRARRKKMRERLRERKSEQDGVTE
jgi:hypothetical protein